MSKQQTAAKSVTAGLPPDFSGGGPAFLRLPLFFSVVGTVKVSGSYIDRLTKLSPSPRPSPPKLLTWLGKNKILSSKLTPNQ